MNIGDKIKSERIKKGYSLEALSDESGISVRTIQRIESNSTNPRGHTLQSLSRALEMDIEQFDKHVIKQDEGLTTLKLMNMSCLLIIFMPLANILAPLLIWYKTRHKPIIHNYGNRILNFQITWILVTSIVLIASPFVQLLFVERSVANTFRAVLFPYLILWIYNIVMTIITASHIGRGAYEKIYPRALKLL